MEAGAKQTTAKRASNEAHNPKHPSLPSSSMSSLARPVVVMAAGGGGGGDTRSASGCSSLSSPPPEVEFLAPTDAAQSKEGRACGSVSERALQEITVADAGRLLRREAEEFGMFVACPEFGSGGDFVCSLRCIVHGREKWLKQAQPLMEQIRAAAGAGAAAQPQLLLHFAPTPVNLRTSSSALASRGEGQDELKDPQEMQAAPYSSSFQRAHSSLSVPGPASVQASPSSASTKRTFAAMAQSAPPSRVDAEEEETSPARAARATSSSTAGSAQSRSASGLSSSSRRLTFSPQVCNDPMLAAAAASDAKMSEPEGESDARTESAESDDAATSATGIVLRLAAAADGSSSSRVPLRAVFTLCRLSCKTAGGVKMLVAYPVGTVLNTRRKQIKYGRKSTLAGLVLLQPNSSIVASDPFALPSNVLGPDACPAGASPVYWPTELMTLCFPRRDGMQLEAVVCEHEKLELRIHLDLEPQRNIDDLLVGGNAALPMRSIEATARMARFVYQVSSRSTRRRLHSLLQYSARVSPASVSLSSEELTELDSQAMAAATRNLPDSVKRQAALLKQQAAQKVAAAISTPFDYQLDIVHRMKAAAFVETSGEAGADNAEDGAAAATSGAAAAAASPSKVAASSLLRVPLAGQVPISEAVDASGAQIYFNFFTGFLSLGPLDLPLGSMVQHSRVLCNSMGSGKTAAMMFTFDAMNKCEQASGEAAMVDVVKAQPEAHPAAAAASAAAAAAAPSVISSSAAPASASVTVSAARGSPPVLCDVMVTRVGLVYQWLENALKYLQPRQVCILLTPNKESLRQQARKRIQALLDRYEKQRPAGSSASGWTADKVCVVDKEEFGRLRAALEESRQPLLCLTDWHSFMKADLTGTCQCLVSDESQQMQDERWRNKLVATFRRLGARLRVCVTGTPFSRPDMRDFAFQLQSLCLPLLSDESAFQRLVLQPFHSLRDASARHLLLSLSSQLCIRHHDSDINYPPLDERPMTCSAPTLEEEVTNGVLVWERASQAQHHSAAAHPGLVLFPGEADFSRALDMSRVNTELLKRIAKHKVHAVDKLVSRLLLTAESHLHAGSFHAALNGYLQLQNAQSELGFQLEHGTGIGEEVFIRWKAGSGYALVQLNPLRGGDPLRRNEGLARMKDADNLLRAYLDNLSLPALRPLQLKLQEAVREMQQFMAKSLDIGVARIAMHGGRPVLQAEAVAAGARTGMGAGGAGAAASSSSAAVSASAPAGHLLGSAAARAAVAPAPLLRDDSNWSNPAALIAESLQALGPRSSLTQVGIERQVEQFVSDNPVYSTRDERVHHSAVLGGSALLADSTRELGAFAIVIRYALELVHCLEAHAWDLHGHDVAALVGEAACQNGRGEPKTAAAAGLTMQQIAQIVRDTPATYEPIKPPQQAAAPSAAVAASAASAASPAAVPAAASASLSAPVSCPPLSFLEQCAHCRLLGVVEALRLQHDRTTERAWVVSHQVHQILLAQLSKEMRREFAALFPKAALIVTDPDWYEEQADDVSVLTDWNLSAAVKAVLEAQQPERGHSNTAAAASAAATFTSSAAALESSSSPAAAAQSSSSFVFARGSVRVRVHAVNQSAFRLKSPLHQPVVPPCFVFIQLPDATSLRASSPAALSRLLSLHRAYQHVWHAADHRFQIHTRQPATWSVLNNFLASFRTLLSKLQRVFAVILPARAVVVDLQQGQPQQARQQQPPLLSHNNSESVGVAAAAAFPAAKSATPLLAAALLSAGAAAAAASPPHAAASSASSSSTDERHRLESRVRMCNAYASALRASDSWRGLSVVDSNERQVKRSRQSGSAAHLFPPSSAKFMSIAGLLRVWEQEYQREQPDTRCRVLVITFTQACQQAIHYYLSVRCGMSVSVPVAPVSDLKAELDAFQFDSLGSFEILVARVEEVGNGVDMPGVHLVILAQAFDEERKANQAKDRAKRKGIQHQPSLARAQTCGTCEERMSYGTLAPDVADRRMQDNQASLLQFPLQQAEPVDVNLERKRSKQAAKSVLGPRDQLLLQQCCAFHLPSSHDADNCLAFQLLLSFLLQAQVPSSVLHSRTCRLQALRLCFGAAPSPVQASWLQHVAESQPNEPLADSASSNLAHTGLIASHDPMALTLALAHSLALEDASCSHTDSHTEAVNQPLAASAAAAAASAAPSVSASSSSSSSSSLDLSVYARAASLDSSVAELLRGRFASFLPYTSRPGTDELGFGSLPLLAQVIQRSITVYMDTSKEPLSVHPIEADAFTQALGHSAIALRYIGDATFQPLGSPQLHHLAESATPAAALAAAFPLAAAPACPPPAHNGPSAMEMDS